ncbi:MAG: T9SS type A sorting domain-containing protein, partial [Bacteroidota bacterium]
IPIRFTVTGSTVSVSPSLESEIEIFPNPTEGKVVLKNPGHMFIESLSVYDIQGRLLRQDALTSGVSEIAVEIQGEAGIYFLRVETKDHGIFTAKLVKQ